MLFHWQPTLDSRSLQGKHRMQTSQTATIQLRSTLT